MTRRPWPRRDWTTGPVEPGRPEGMEARLAVIEAAARARAEAEADDETSEEER